MHILNVTLKPKCLGWWGLPSEQAPLGNVEGFPGGSDGKASARNVGDLGSIPGSGRSPGEGNGNPLQDSCLENPMDGGIWRATVHGVAKSRTRLSNFIHGGGASVSEAFLKTSKPQTSSQYGPQPFMSSLAGRRHGFLPARRSGLQYQ